MTQLYTLQFIAIQFLLGKLTQSGGKRLSEIRYVISSVASSLLFRRVDIRCLRFPVYILAVMVIRLPASAALITVDVDFSGTDSLNGHTLRVFGTLSVDPITDMIGGSSLTMQHQADPIVPIQSFSGPGTPGVDLDWVLVGSSLYITRVTDDLAFVVWCSFPGGIRVFN